MIRACLACRLVSVQALLKSVAAVLVARFLWKKWQERQYDSITDYEEEI